MSEGDDRCTCEQQEHGDLGVVRDDERLARVVSHPNHFRKDGTLKPGAFPPSHIAKSGLSLIRVDHLTVGEILRTSQAIVGMKAGEELKGVMLCPTKELRALMDDDQRRSICVIDDPVVDDPILPDNPAHAIAIKSAQQDEAEIERIRLELIDLFCGPIEIDKIHE